METTSGKEALNSPAHDRLFREYLPVDDRDPPHYHRPQTATTHRFDRNCEKRQERKGDGEKKHVEEVKQCTCVDLCLSA